MFLRMILKKWGLVIGFLLCLIVMFLCNMTISIECSVEWLKFVKDAAFCITGSYIAGYIFYIFSVLYPQFKRQRPIYKVISQNIVYAKSELMDLSYNVYGKFDIEGGAFIDHLAKRNNEDNYEISQKNCINIALAMSNIKKFIESPVFMTEYLEQTDLEKICEVIKSVTKIHTQVSEAIPNQLYLGKKEYKVFVDTILNIYHILEDVLTNLKKIA